MSEMLRGMPKGARQPSLRFVLNWYDACLRQAETVLELANIYGKSEQTVKKWIDNYKTLRIARELALEKRKNEKAHAENMRDVLSEEAYQIWNTHQTGDITKHQLVHMGPALNGRPKKLKQQLFLVAMMKTNYRLTEACRVTGTTRTEVTRWKNTDPEFMQLFAELQHLRNEEVGGALMDLVKERNPQAVIYADKKLTDQQGHGAGMYDEEDIVKFEDLREHLDVETMRNLLRAMEAVGTTTKYDSAPIEV